MSVLDAIAGWPPPTTAAAVVGPGGVVAGYGPVEQPFYLASVTKPLTALAALVAVEEGALELTDPADEALVPGATVRHLLAHASGLGPERPVRSFPPGVRRVYSNVGMERVGSLVQDAVGMPFASYLDEAVVAPLGMRATTLRGSPAKDGWASVADLALVVVELLSTSGWLHPSTLADAATIQYPGLRGVLPGFGSQDPNDWGLGVEIRGHKSPHWTGATNSPATFGHFGQSGTMLWVDPVAALGLIALSDVPFDDWARTAWPALSDAVLRAYT